MKYLNLTKWFNPYNAPEEDLIKFESFFFNGGEPHIKIDIDSICDDDNQEECLITTRITSMNDLMMLMVAHEALDQSGRSLDDIGLFIPYFPGGRMDRRTSQGEPLSVKVFANMINSLGCNPVQTFDDHSEVTNALLENTYNENNHKLVDTCICNIYPDDVKDYKRYHLISPDAGANKKIINLAKSIGSDSVIKCDKTRSTFDGRLTGFTVYSDDLQGKDCIIVDDICDGGGTFIGLAKELKKKNAGKLYLIVSHGIFSKGFTGLNDYFEKIYTTDSFDKNGSELEVVKFKDFM